MDTHHLQKRGHTPLMADKQSCEVQWVVSLTWGDTKDQSRHADTSACSDWLYVERRCVPWLKQPWNGANQPVWGYRHKNRMIQHRNWIWTGFHYNLFDISLNRATDLLHVYSSVYLFFFGGNPFPLRSKKNKCTKKVNYDPLISLFTVIMTISHYVTSYLSFATYFLIMDFILQFSSFQLYISHCDFTLYLTINVLNCF